MAKQKNNNRFIFIYITNSSEKEAEKIAKHLINKKLIACGNIFPIKSIYKWKNRIVNKKEFVLIVKTVDSKFERVKKEIEKVHSYEIPCIAKIHVNSNKNYFNWVRKEVDKR